MLYLELEKIFAATYELIMGYISNPGKRTYLPYLISSALLALIPYWVSKNKKGPKFITLGVSKFKHDIPKKNHGPSRKANQKTHYIQRNYWFNSLGVPSSNKKTALVALPVCT